MEQPNTHVYGLGTWHQKRVRSHLVDNRVVPLPGEPDPPGWVDWQGDPLLLSDWMVVRTYEEAIDIRDRLRAGDLEALPGRNPEYDDLLGTDKWEVFPIPLEGITSDVITPETRLREEVGPVHPTPEEREECQLCARVEEWNTGAGWDDSQYSPDEWEDLTAAVYHTWRRPVKITPAPEDMDEAYVLFTNLFCSDGLCNGNFRTREKLDAGEDPWADDVVELLVGMA